MGETSRQGMITEIREELGVIFNESDAVFYKTLRDDNAKDFKDIWLFKNDSPIEDIKFEDGEVVDARWVTIDKFLEMKENKEMISTIDLGMEEYNLALEKIHNVNG